MTPTEREVLDSAMRAYPPDRQADLSDVPAVVEAVRNLVLFRDAFYEAVTGLTRAIQEALP